MATLFNTLLASLFPALFGAQQKEPVTSPISESIEITVSEEPVTECELKIYFYESV